MHAQRFLLPLILAFLPAFSSAAQVLCGDCDGSGDVTIIDSLRIAQIDVGVLAAPGWCGAEFAACNPEGIRCPSPGAGISVLDALSVARHVVGGGPALDCGTPGPGSPPPASRPVVLAYVETLRFGYTAQIARLDYSAVDLVIHGFVAPDAGGGLTEYANFTDLRTYPWAVPPEVPLPDAVHAAGKRIVMSIGGATVPGSIFATIAEQPATRTAFVANVVAHLDAIGYDGVDIDYEWPASVQQGADFTLLMQELYAAVKGSNPQRVVLFGAGPGYYIGFRQWDLLGPWCDHAFLFGYDWRNPSLGPMTNPGVNLWSASGDVFEASVRGAVDLVLARGFPAEKLVVGLPFYSSRNESWSAQMSSLWAAGAPWPLHPDYQEVQINGSWWTPPEGIAAKMDSLLDPGRTVLTGPGGPAVVGGVGWWEWGHEDATTPDLTRAVQAWLARHP